MLDSDVVAIQCMLVCLVEHCPQSKGNRVAVVIHLLLKNFPVDLASVYPQSNSLIDNVQDKTVALQI